MNDSSHRREDDDIGVKDEESFEPAVEQDPERPGINWNRIGESMSALRDAIVNLALLCFFTALIGIVVIELVQKAVIIEPIRMPEPLSAVGYTEDVAAQRLTDAIAEIKEAAPTSLQGVNWMPASQQVDFEAPETGITLRNVVQVLRQAMKLPETRISGEFICATADCAHEALTLRLRVVTREGMKIIKPVAVGTERSLDDYYRAAALDLLRELDPYLVAAYLYVSDKAAAEREAFKILGPDNPQRKWAMNLLGFMAAEREDYDTAIGWYRRAAEADENDRFAIAYANWGNALLKKDKELVDEAIAKQQRAIDIDRDFAFAHLSLAEALAAQGKREEAMAKIAEAAAIDPPSAYAYSVWGKAYYALFEKDRRPEDLAAAAEKFRQATEIDPKDWLAFFNWGRALDDQKKIEEAVHKYTLAVELEADHIGANINLGIDLRKLGREEEAIKRFEHVIAIAPGNASALYNLGRVRAGQKDGLAEALTLYERAALLTPNDSDIQLNWGIALVKGSKFSEGLEKIRLAAKLNDENSMAHLTLGSILQMMNHKAEAADALERYLELEPKATNAAILAKQVEALRAEAAPK
jgi:tetratricopeptide (TPR) repeat protein